MPKVRRKRGEAVQTGVSSKELSRIALKVKKEGGDVADIVLHFHPHLKESFETNPDDPDFGEKFAPFKEMRAAFTLKMNQIRTGLREEAKKRGLPDGTAEKVMPMFRAASGSLKGELTELFGMLGEVDDDDENYDEEMDDSEE